MTHGTVAHWTLTVASQDGTTTENRFHSWEAVTEAFRDATKLNPKWAEVYAVPRRGVGNTVKTWSY